MLPALFPRLSGTFCLTRLFIACSRAVVFATYTLLSRIKAALERLSISNPQDHMGQCGCWSYCTAND